MQLFSGYNNIALRRSRIEPWAWVLNACLSAGNVTDPLLMARARLERPHIKEVRSRLAARTCLVPYLAEEPIGRELLFRLTKVETRSMRANSGGVDIPNGHGTEFAPREGDGIRSYRRKGG